MLAGFFEGFALAFHTSENVAFTIHLLTEWLVAASRPLMGDVLDTGSWGADAVFAPTRGARLSDRSVRARAEAKRCRRLVTSLLRMLTSFIRQYAPTECSSEQFAALAPIVVAHFTHFTHLAQQKIDLQEDVARTAESLLSEMVARAPVGTPPSIFSLLSMSAPPPAVPERPQRSADRSRFSSRVAWDGGLISPEDAAALYPSLCECSNALQKCAIEGAAGIELPSVAGSAHDHTWPAHLPRAALAELPRSEMPQSQGHRSLSPSVREGGEVSQQEHRLPSMRSASPAGEALNDDSSQQDSVSNLVPPGSLRPSDLTNQGSPGNESSPGNEISPISSAPQRRASESEHVDESGGGAGMVTHAQERLRGDPVSESVGSWISTIGPLARLDEHDASSDGEDEDEQLMVGIEDISDDDDEGHGTDLDDSNSSVVP